jgi:hypothetical protein
VQRNRADARISGIVKSIAEVCAHSSKMLMAAMTTRVPVAAVDLPFASTPVLSLVVDVTSRQAAAIVCTQPRGRSVRTGPVPAHAKADRASIDSSRATQIRHSVASGPITACLFFVQIWAAKATCKAHPPNCPQRSVVIGTPPQSRRPTGAVLAG